jgi:hypothetical protein
MESLTAAVSNIPPLTYGGAQPLALESARPACLRSEKFTHLKTIRDVTPSALGCEECLRSGDAWAHLRICRHMRPCRMLRPVPEPASDQAFFI